MLKSNLARFIALSGTQSAHSVLTSKVNKLEIAKNPTRDDVDAFVQAFKAFCAVQGVDLIVVNRRATVGQGAGGAATFISEGVLLTSSPVPIAFAHPATLKATERKKHALKIARPGTVDLGLAYDLAFERLPS